MFRTGGYPAHPPNFSSYDYPPRTPQNNGSNNYYSPRRQSYTAPPSKSHARRATGDPSTFTTYRTSAFSTPPRKSFFSTPEYSSPGYFTSAQSTPLYKSDYVSGFDRRSGGTRSYRVPACADGKTQWKHSSSKHYSSHARVVFEDLCDRSYEYLPRYEQYETSPPSYRRSQSYYEPGADYSYYDQIPIHTPADVREKARPRRASYSAKPSKQTPPRRPNVNVNVKSPPQATDADAQRAGIPAGYSIKNWDPTEEPILLLGSVFDANSLGKWIYDWTVYFYGPALPMSDVAGDLWLLLIQLAGKVKRAEECLSRIRQRASRDLVDEFLESGERLWVRFTKLLKICESSMWSAAKKESSGAGKVIMSLNSGCEFVDCMFGRDRELERTEKLMASMRLWSMRFDANCEEILQNPSA